MGRERGSKANYWMNAYAAGGTAASARADTEDALAGIPAARGAVRRGRTTIGKAEFDVVVALYHDQGLAPLKVIDFDEAVNVTLGLPHVRTSPDHGTAFGIASKGLARATSYTNAVAVARRLIAARTVAHTAPPARPKPTGKT